jgi:hypothetical protein
LNIKLNNNNQRKDYKIGMVWREDTSGRESVNEGD